MSAMIRRFPDFEVTVVERRTFLEVTEALPEACLPRSRSDSALFCQAWDSDEALVATSVGGEDIVAESDSVSSGASDSEDASAVALQFEQRRCGYKIVHLTPVEKTSDPLARQFAPDIVEMSFSSSTCVAMHHRPATLRATDIPQPHDHLLARKAVRHSGGRSLPIACPCLHGSRPREDSQTERTTLIVRSIPCHWMRAEVAKVLDSGGFRGRYDFIHVPVKFSDLNNAGYALVNMTTERSGAEAKRHLEGLTLVEAGQALELEVGWNEPTQGLAAHVHRYRNSSMMHESVPEIYRPGLFKDGIAVAFPAPTEAVKPPRKAHLLAIGCAQGSAA